MSSLQNSIKNIQTNRLRILEPSVNNSIFCKEFKGHFVNVNIRTLLIYRYTCWLLKALSFHKDDRTCEIEKDYIIDPFNKSNSFNRVRLVSGYSQPWIVFILMDCPFHMFIIKGAKCLESWTYLWDWERWYHWSIWRIKSIQLCPIDVWILPSLDWFYPDILSILHIDR